MAWKRRKKKARFCFTPLTAIAMAAARIEMARAKMWIETKPGSGVFMDCGNIENVSITIDPA
jgi:hypothetical protein